MSPVVRNPTGVDMVTLADIRNEALVELVEAEDGQSLDALTRELLEFAVRISVTTLDTGGARVHAQRALQAGATSGQLHEVVLLVSGLGVHSLFEGTRLLQELAPEPSTPRDAQRQQLWDQWVGQDRYWKGFEREVPGFLDALLQVSPSGFDAFFRYCAVPWTDPQLPPLCKELIAMASDATPTHRFMPGLRLHLRNALRLGAGRAAVLEALDIAAQAPEHPGVR
ncbi:hypothetical protein O4H66_15720 [Comamonadaceae bacterium G21597-S1]|nr:hypothetical protein [Comamonadaceae bacterium G21597-S1]